MKEEPSFSSSPMSRREFFKVAFITISGFIAAMAAWPFVSFLLNPNGKNEGERFVKVPHFPSVPVGKPAKLTFQYIEDQAFLRQNMFYDVWVIKSPSGEATVFSPLCTHLSCRYDWKSSEQTFSCPCHGSVFNNYGEVIAGPAPRPLDSLPHKIKDGELYVDWKVFKPGIHSKVEI